MATGVQMFKIQSEYYITNLEKFLFGEQDNHVPGIDAFHAQMVDIYDRLSCRARNKTKVVYGEGDLSKFLRNRCITYDEFYKIFLLREVNYDLAPVGMATAYNRIVDATSKFNDKKNKILFSGRGMKGIVRDVMLDYNAFCYLNTRFNQFVKAFEEYREKSLDFLSPSGEFGQNNIIKYNDKVFIKQIDSRYKQVLETYNNLVLDEKRGSKILFDSVGRLINERLSSYNDISKVYSTKFGQKYVFKPTELPNVDMSPLAL